MLHDIGVNWATDYTDGEKNGRLIVKEEYDSTEGYATFGPGSITFNVKRNRWVSNGAWKFTENKDRLLEMIPKYE